MTEKEKLVKFLNKKLKDAKEKLEEISKEIEFINAAVRAIKEKETVEPNLIDGIEKDFSYHLCPDQYVGKIRHKDNWQKFYKRTDIFKDQTSETKITITEDKILLLILESPHTDEFDKNGEPIGPANGPTGRNIREHIAEIFPNFSDYHLILMNAIPFQCSLGIDPKHFRDDVFNKAWAEENIGAKFFEARLENLLKKLSGKNIVIVNACTKGEEKKTLYCNVCRSIISVLTKDGKEYPIEFYHTHHPVSWIYRKTLTIDKRSISEKSYDFNCKEDKNLEKCYGKIKYKFNK